MKRINQILLLSLFLFLFACSTWNENVDSSVVASVGDARLLAETVKSQIPAYLGSEERQKYAEKIIEKWVKEQILVQTARQSNTSLSSGQLAKVMELQRGYLIENYLDIMFLEKQNSFSDSEIEQYYQAHSDDYLFEEEMVSITQLTFESKVDEIFAAISSEKDLDLIIERYGLHSRVGEPLINGRLGFIREASLSEDIRKRIRYLKPGDYRGPFRQADRFVFIQVHDRKKSGDAIPLALVRDEIQAILTWQMRNQLRDQIIKERRADFVIKTDVDKLISGDF
jgi:hypothetical protein